MGILYTLGVREQPQVLVLTFHLDFEIVFLVLSFPCWVRQVSSSPKLLEILLSLFLISLWELWDYGL